MKWKLHIRVPAIGTIVEVTDEWGRIITSFAEHRKNLPDEHFIRRARERSSHLGEREFVVERERLFNNPRATVSEVALARQVAERFAQQHDTSIYEYSPDKRRELTMRFGLPSTIWTNIVAIDFGRYAPLSWWDEDKNCVGAVMYPPKYEVRNNPSPDDPETPDDFDDALSGYRRFQKLEPREIGVFAGLHIPTRLARCGTIIHILYRSDKWENKEHNYIHEHDAGVMVCRPDMRTGSPIEVPAAVRKATTLYRLGDCQGFRYEDEHGDPVDAKVRRPYPELYSIPSGKALLVIETHTSPARLAAAIWGGHLDVKDVGIVG